MGRKKKVKPFQWIEERLKLLLESASIRDIVYVVAYLSAVNIAYIGIKGITQTGYFWLPPSWYPFAPFLPRPKKEEPIDYKALSMALVAAYMVLKIDIEDVASAIKLVSKTGLSSLVAVP